MTDAELIIFVDEYLDKHLATYFWHKTHSCHKHGAIEMALGDILARVANSSLDAITAGSALSKAIAEQAVYLARNYESLNEGKIITNEAVDSISATYSLINSEDVGLSPRALSYIKQAQREARSKIRISRG